MPQSRFDPRAPRSTRLTGLELKNFKSVRQADITIGALTVIFGANSTGKSIDVVPPGLERPVTLSAVGVGVSQVLPVIVQCLVAGPGALVVLEQPELHLHPAAQQRLADFFLACTAWGQNLLVESHSEYLVLRLRRRIAEDPADQLKDDLVLLFASRDRGGETKYQPIELTNTGALVEWPAGFFDQGSDEAHQLLIASAAKQRRDS